MERSEEKMERDEEKVLSNILKSLLCPPCHEEVVKRGLVGDLEGRLKKEGEQAQVKSVGESSTTPAAVCQALFASDEQVESVGESSTTPAAIGLALLEGPQNIMQPPPGLTVCSEQQVNSVGESSTTPAAVVLALLEGPQNTMRPPPGLTLCNEQQKQEWRDFFSDTMGVDYENVRFLQTRTASENSDTPSSSVPNQQQPPEDHKSQLNQQPVRSIIPGRQRSEGPSSWWNSRNMPSVFSRGSSQLSAAGSQKRGGDVRAHREKTISSAVRKMETMVHSLSESVKNMTVLPMQIKSMPNLYFLDFSIEDQPSGKVIIETEPYHAPILSANFAALCTMTVKGLSYKDCRVFTCAKGKYLISGDNVNNDGTEGKSVVVLRKDFTEVTNLDVVRGSVAMVRPKFRVKSITSHFKIIVNDQPEGDEVVFGRVVAGIDLVDKIVDLGNYRRKPKKSIIITDCGKYE